MVGEDRNTMSVVADNGCDLRWRFCIPSSPLPFTDTCLPLLPPQLGLLPKRRQRGLDPTMPPQKLRDLIRSVAGEDRNMLGVPLYV